MTSVLLIGNIFSEGSTSLYVLKALMELGCEVDVWDTNISPKPPNSKRYDISLTWTNNLPDLDLVNADKKILYYLDDPTYYTALFPPEHQCQLYNAKKGYDKLFTCVLIPGHESLWLPMGTDHEILKPLDYPFERRTDCVFIGTLRDSTRRDFVFELAKKLREKRLSFQVWGNNWEKLPEWGTKPIYFQAFNIICNRAKTVINKHFNLGTSTKVHEIASSGGGLFLCDEGGEAVQKCYPSIITYKTVQEAVELIEHYSKMPSEAQNIAKKLRKESEQFSYTKQLKKLLNSV